MSSLLLLSPFSLVPVLSEWLSDFDLCRLDTAVCSRSHRDKFLGTLSKCQVINTYSYRKYYYEIFEWLLLRGIGLKKVDIPFYESHHCNQLRKVLANTHHISYMRIHSYADSLPIICDLGLHVDTLRVDNAEEIPKVLNSLTFEELDLSSNFNLTSAIVDSIASHFGSLTSISVPRLVDLSVILKENHFRKFKCGLNSVCTAVKERTIGEFQSATPDNSAIFYIGDNPFVLTCLEVDECIVDEVVSFLCPLVANLTDLWIVSTNSEVPAPLMLAFRTKCSKLTTFHAFNASLNESDYVALFSHSPLMTFVHIYYCTGVTDIVLETLASHCKLLESLTVNERSLSEQVILNVLDACLHLSEVDLGGGVLTEFTVNLIAVNKRSLVLGRSVYGVDRLTFGSKFSIQMERNLGFFDLITVFSQNPLLTSVELSRLDQLDCGAYERLAVCCPLLTSITVYRCKSFTGCCFSSFARCTNLTSLSVDDVIGITDEKLNAVLRGKFKMVKLGLSNSKGFTDLGLAMIGLHCPLLRNLDLSGCTVTTSVVSEILQKCKHINVLKLEGCGVSIDVFAAMEARPMRYVNIKGCEIATRSEEFLALNLQCSCELVC